MDELTRDRSAMSLEAANREVYRLLKEGIPVSVMDADSTPHPGPLPIGSADSAEAETEKLVASHSSLRAACLAGALVFVVAFWFDGGLFDLPTAAMFWVLIELGVSRGEEG